jgi:hypothetical protein
MAAERKKKKIAKRRKAVFAIKALIISFLGQLSPHDSLPENILEG